VLAECPGGRTGLNHRGGHPWLTALDLCRAVTDSARDDRRAQSATARRTRGRGAPATRRIGSGPPSVSVAQISFAHMRALRACIASAVATDGFGNTVILAGCSFHPHHAESGFQGCGPHAKSAIGECDLLRMRLSGWPLITRRSARLPDSMVGVECFRRSRCKLPWVRHSRRRKPRARPNRRSATSR